MSNMDPQFANHLLPDPNLNLQLISPAIDPDFAQT